MSSPQHIAIIGASSGLGAALALEYSESGTALAICARRKVELMKVAEACRAKGSQVEARRLDITDAAACHALAAAMPQPLHLLILNAGIITYPPADSISDDPTEVVAMLKTNLQGAINLAAAFAERMATRGTGRIVFISSMAALYPMADAPAYSASKAGLAAYATALRQRLEPRGIAVTLVLPGHIETAQTRDYSGPLPFLLSATEAARRIRRGLDSRRDEIIFPRRLKMLIALGRFLPRRLRDRAAASLGLA